MVWVRIWTFFLGAKYSQKNPLQPMHSYYLCWIMKLTIPEEVAWFKNEKA